MAQYATIEDIQQRITRELSEEEQIVCNALLNDAGLMIDAVAPGASAEVKKVVTCRMVARALGDGGSAGVPVGASQGSMSALGYSQSWTIGSGGSVGELYLSKSDRQMLGRGKSIGFHGPMEVEL